jgi:hypothetical protein
MKTPKAGIVAVAILLAVTGIGFGIAQAGGNHSEQPVLSFEDMEAQEHGSSSSSYMETASQEFVPEDNWSGTDWQTQVAISSVEDTQMQNPIETGSLPYEELNGTEFPFPVGFVAHSNEELDPFSRSGP